MIIIGNKPYKNINISEIIDQFNFNIRFNFGLPGDNNGTKTYMQIVNLHVDINLKKNNLDIPSYKHIDKNYKNEIKKQLKPDNYPFGIILMEHYRKKFYNIFLKNNKCPYTISTLPRMGIHGVMTSVIDNKRPFVTHFSFNKEDNKTHSYNNIDNHKQSSIYHSPNEEFNILKWLHDNDKIDATLCLLLDTQIPTLECSFIKPKFESIMLLLEKFGICVLNNFFKEDDIDKLNNQLIKNKIQKFLIKKDSNNIIIKYK